MSDENIEIDRTPRRKSQRKSMVDILLSVQIHREDIANYNESVDSNQTEKNILDTDSNENTEKDSYLPDHIKKIKEVSNVLQLELNDWNALCILTEDLIWPSKDEKVTVPPGLMEMFAKSDTLITESRELQVKRKIMDEMRSVREQRAYNIQLQKRSLLLWEADNIA